MMGKTHALSGAAAGCTIAAVTGMDPAPAAVLAITAAGAAYLPDLDHPGSTPSRALGPVTGLLSRAVAGVSRMVVSATARPADTVRGAHRTATHSLAGVAVTAVLAYASVAAGGPVVAACGCALLSALGAGAFGMPAIVRLAVAAAVAAAAVTGTVAVSPTAAAAITAAGMVAHIAGDGLTRSGVPLAGGIAVAGRAWRMVHLAPAPLRITTGTPAERAYMVAFCAIIAASIAHMAGVL